MTFDDWMVGISERHKPTDDGITLRMLRACWSAAQAAEHERCAKLCDPTNADRPDDWTEYAKTRAECAARIRGA